MEESQSLKNRKKNIEIIKDEVGVDLNIPENVDLFTRARVFFYRRILNIAEEAVAYMAALFFAVSIFNLVNIRLGYLAINWFTFWQNIVLFVLVVGLSFLSFRKISGIRKQVGRWKKPDKDHS